MTVTVTLTPGEMKLAAMAGVLSRSNAIIRGQQNRYSFDGDPWDTDVESIGAEMALAKYENCYYMPGLARQTKGDRDVGAYDVRYTHRTDGSLILHPSDEDHVPFVLVVGRIPTFALVGWIYARDGKRPQYWRTDTGRPAYFVPSPP